jgi:hypothetical protein
MTTQMLNKHGTLFVDNTLLAAVASCSTQAVLRHALGYTVSAEAPKLRAGKAAHSATECWLKGGSVDEAMAIFKRDYGDWADKQLLKENERGYPNALGSYSTSQILRYYFQENRPETLPLEIDPAFVEVGFQVPLTKETVRSPVDGKLHPAIIAYGRMDLFGRRKSDGSLWAEDHKFTTRVSNDYMRQFYLDSQVSHYVWAARRSFGKDVRGMYINAVPLFYSLPQSSKKCAKHGNVSYDVCRSLHVEHRLEAFTRSEEQLEEWWKTAVHLAKRYRDLCQRFPTLEDIHKVRSQGMFHKKCRWCHFKEWCESGRPAWAADGVLEYDPWMPFDPEKEEDVVEKLLIEHRAELDLIGTIHDEEASYSYDAFALVRLGPDFYLLNTAGCSCSDSRETWGVEIGPATLDEVKAFIESGHYSGYTVPKLQMADFLELIEDAKKEDYDGL